MFDILIFITDLNFYSLNIKFNISYLLEEHFLIAQYYFEA